MELRSIEDWTCSKSSSGPNVVTFPDSGGTVRIPGARGPTSWCPTDWPSGQVEQQLAIQHINAGGSFVKWACSDERSHARLFHTVHDIEQTA